MWCDYLNNSPNVQSLKMFCHPNINEDNVESTNLEVVVVSFFWTVN